MMARYRLPKQLETDVVIVTRTLLPGPACVLDWPSSSSRSWIRSGNAHKRTRSLALKTLRTPGGATRRVPRLAGNRESNASVHTYAERFRRLTENLLSVDTCPRTSDSVPTHMRIRDDQITRSQLALARLPPVGRPWRGIDPPCHLLRFERCRRPSWLRFGDLGAGVLGAGVLGAD